MNQIRRGCEDKNYGVNDDQLIYDYEKILEFIMINIFAFFKINQFNLIY